MQQFQENQERRVEAIDAKRLRRRPDQSACINQGIRDSVIRLLFDSELEIGSLRKAASLAGTSEGKALAIVRNYVYDMRIMSKPEPPPSSPARPLRRAA